MESRRHRHLRGRPVRVRAGQPIAWPEIAAQPSPGAVMRELCRLVYALRHDRL